MQYLFIIGAIANLALVSAHQALFMPTPRYESSTNGLMMGPKVEGNFNQNNDRQYVVRFHEDFHSYPCGGAPVPEYTQTVYNQGPNMDSEPELFDFSTLDGPVSKTFTAGSEVTLEMLGYHHPGVARVSICYEDCMDLKNYEQFILGYYYHQGVDGSPVGDIYSADIQMTVKMPMRNCENCVLQWADDTDDGRSYVSCASISITGGSDTADYVECNGHPFCNCTPEDDMSSQAATAASPTGEYGLGKKCPGNVKFDIQEGEGPWEWEGSVIDQIGVEEFCKYCADQACPAACGSVWDSAYVSREKVWRRDLAYPTGLNEPQYVKCSAQNPCNCPGCIEQQPWGGANAVEISWGFDVSAASVTIKAGTTVTWNWDQDGSEHDVVSGPRGSAEAGSLFRSAFQSDGSFTHTFETEGEFPYFCTPHSNMEAVITVEPAPAVDPTDDPTTTVDTDEPTDEPTDDYDDDTVTLLDDWTKYAGMYIGSGNDLGPNGNNGEDITVDVCKNECSKLVECLGITYSLGLGKCWLKSSLEDVQDAESFSYEVKGMVDDMDDMDDDSVDDSTDDTREDISAASTMQASVAVSAAVAVLAVLY